MGILPRITHFLAHPVGRVIEKVVDDWRGKNLNTLAWLVQPSALRLYNKHGSQALFSRLRILPCFNSQISWFMDEPVPLVVPRPLTAYIGSDCLRNYKSVGH